MTSSLRRFAVATASVIVVIAPRAFGQTQTPGRSASSALVVHADPGAAVERTASLAAPSVVEVFATSFAAGRGVLPRGADLVTTQRTSGSGVIVDPSGYIVTNAHVVRGAERVRIGLSPGQAGRSVLAAPSRLVDAVIVGVDLETDLAVLKVDGRQLPALPFGDSDALRQGQLVIAIGSPLGFDRSVSLGVVSSVARQLEAESPMVYVQTDAQIAPGSSGGPLVDLNGRVVGINTLVFSADDGHDGPGFAAPSNIVRFVYEQIRENGRVRRGDIGARGQTITPLVASALALPVDRGVVLADVLPFSPAYLAGLEAGDIVVGVDGKAMENARQLQVNLYRRSVGDVVRVEVLRDGALVDVPVRVAERPDAMASLGRAVDPRRHLVRRLGVLGIALDSEVAALVPVVRVTFGVVVAATAEGAIDDREGGLAVGDVIFAVNRQPIATLEELRTALDGLRAGDPVVLHLERRGELRLLPFVID